MWPCRIVTPRNPPPLGVGRPQDRNLASPSSELRGKAYFCLFDGGDDEFAADDACRGEAETGGSRPGPGEKEGPGGHKIMGRALVQDRPTHGLGPAAWPQRSPQGATPTWR